MGKAQLFEYYYVDLRPRNRWRVVGWITFLLFALSNLNHLHRPPGLLVDSHNVNGDDPSQMTERETRPVPVIPRRLAFNYKSDILKERRPADLYRNIKRTVTMYTKAWADASEVKSQSKSTKTTEPQQSNSTKTRTRRTAAAAAADAVVVAFLTDDGCRGAIHDAFPDLVAHFDNETIGQHRSDMCRVADLYLNGGYYHDNDMVVLEAAIMPDRRVRFATVLEQNDQNFFQSFLASVPRHPVLSEAMNVMLDYYEGRRLKDRLDRDRHQSGMGTKTLKDAYDVRVTSEPEIAESVRLLREVNLRKERYLYRDYSNVVIPKRTMAVHWPEGHRVHFLSRLESLG